MTECCYQPLVDMSTHVRLLRLGLANPGDKINLDMSVRALTEAFRFRAISYTWGDLGVKLIVVSGEVVEVRWNCFYALYQARCHYSSEYVWIDSICINQIDPEEKAIQVAIMFDIYSNASGVLASLGDHSEDSKTLLDGRCFEEARKFNDKQLQVFWSIEKFGSRPRWSGLWSIQELFAAKGTIWIRSSWPGVTPS